MVGMRRPGSFPASIISTPPVRGERSVPKDPIYATRDHENPGAASSVDRASAHSSERDGHGWKVDHTLGFAHLGGATLDNEENYLIKKFFSAMGALQIENQARI